MNISAELLDLYVKKKLVNKRDAEGFLAAAEKENCDIREYLYKKELINEISELDVLSEYYHTPSIELECSVWIEPCFPIFRSIILKRTSFCL